MTSIFVHRVHVSRTVRPIPIVRPIPVSYVIADIEAYQCIWGYWLIVPISIYTIIDINSPLALMVGLPGYNCGMSSRYALDLWSPAARASGWAYCFQEAEIDHNLIPQATTEMDPWEPIW